MANSTSKEGDIIKASFFNSHPPLAVFTDTHCHIHDSEFFPDGGDTLYERAKEAGVRRMFCVGTDIRSSKEAVGFSADKEGVYAIVGIHPHDSEKETPQADEFFSWCHENKSEKLIGVGEIGLDYHYNNSPHGSQLSLLEKQIDLALSLDVPVSFHVRDAFDDFWPLFDNFKGVRGVLHSFTDNVENMEKGLERGLYIGINGIATFAKDRDEVTMAAPLDKILLETDAPFLTPVPLRGRINEPGNVPLIASYVAGLRGTTVEELSQRTERNVDRLFF